MTVRRAWSLVAGLPARGLVLLARAYQLTLSRYLGGQCRYFPTCSQYFIEAVQARGALRGGLMGLRRVLRCHPLGRGGYDPPPPGPTKPL